MGISNVRNDVKMKLFTLFALQVTNAVNLEHEQFQSWMAKYEKNYDSYKEYNQRLKVFSENIEQINQINSENRGWMADVNKFTDLTWDEFKHYYLMKGGQNCSATSVNGPEILAKKPRADPPKWWDWRMFGAVTHVKDQGQCGSCWTFSTTGNVESGAIIHTGHRNWLSEQQLVDCSQNFNNHGCNGGLPSQAFEYIAAAPGIMTEADYPYTAKDGKCVFDAQKAVVNVVSSVNLTALDENEMQMAMLGYQPVSIAFEVVNDFMHYKNGTYSSTTCKNGPEDVNHAVLAVGYGTDHDGKEFWTVKNSWSTDWGNHGYFDIERGVNMCGLAQCTSFALIQP